MDPTSHGPGIASVGNRLILAACAPSKTSENETLHLYISDDGGANFHLSYVYPSPPDKTVFGNDLRMASFKGHFRVGWCRTDGNFLDLAESNDSNDAINPKALGDLPNQDTHFVPGLCEFKDKLVIAHSGPDDGHIYVRTWDDLEGGKVVPQSADSGVALATDGQRLFLAWAGTDDAHTLNVMTASSLDFDFGQPQTLNGQTSDRTPALAWCNGQLYLVWKGSNNNFLNWASAADGFNPHILSDDSTDECPSAASLGNRLFIAWRGTDPDNHANVMSVPI